MPEYTARKGLTYKTAMSQRIYELKKVNPDIKQFGEVRLLDERDMYFSHIGLRHFMQLVLMEIHRCLSRKTEKHIATGYQQKALCFRSRWDTCLYGRIYKEMQTAIGVAFVYTPPYFRGKGYATSCVAQIESNGTGERIYQVCIIHRFAKSNIQ